MRIIYTITWMDDHLSRCLDPKVDDVTIRYISKVAVYQQYNVITTYPSNRIRSHVDVLSGEYAANLSVRIHHHE
jgi:hypothetical protein